MAIARETGFLEHDGERIYWESCGSGDAVVLCHGAGGNHAVWYQQVKHFAKTRRVVTWDHRGFGRSSATRGPTTPALAAGDLDALLRHLSIENCDLVGQSMGGWTVAGFALAHPERTRRLVLADTPGGVDCPGVRAAISDLASAPRPLAVPPHFGVHPALGAPFCEEHPGRAYLYQALGGFGEPDLAKIAAPLLATTLPQAAVRDYAGPVLLVVGELDTLFPPKAIEEAAAQFTDARVEVIPRCGHSPYFEAPQVWNQVVDDFLR